MDPLTAYLIVALMMLLNGGVLGLMHGDLSPDVQPSAISWRIGTLLQACGCILLGVQTYLPPLFVLPLANGMVMLGVAGCWRAVRQFYGRGESAAVLLPTVLATAGIAWFAGPQPDLAARVAIATLAWVVMLLAAAWTVLRAIRGERARSARVLAGIFVLLAAFMLLRGVYFVVSAPIAGSIVDTRSWINALTPILASVLPVIGTTGFLLLCSDRMRRRWEQAASTDDLTGLANRRTLAAAGALRLRQARDDGSALAVAIVDIDHFKSVNDRFGHETGDLALRHVAARLRSACGRRHLLARQGGEEFVALLDVDGSEAAVDAAERLRGAVRAEPFRHGDTVLTLSVSIGVAALVPQDRHLDDLLRRADLALYAAKHGGRDRVVAAPPPADPA
ncbi:GGDEF domain-containing protein [Tahibacter caeni]|uniref:GGDEF domain-containing protein n=1 Tax=Tahibacter caeni TaxID=1453545 RepID=UPI002148BA75|nr:GGDEF domain-containing protein [Tahibacter caeni]